MKVLTKEETRYRLALMAGGESRVPAEFDDLFDNAYQDVSLDAATHPQLNKLLIAAGHSRVSRDWFDFFCSLTEEPVGQAGSFDRRLSAWRTLTMLKYANFRYPFRELRSASSSVIKPALDPSSGRVIGSHRLPLGIRDIEEFDRPFLGYIAGGLIQTLKTVGEEDLDDHSLCLIERHDRAEQSGSHNLYEYVTAEQMDVYVATSMRTSEDFYAVSRFTSAMFDGLGDEDPISRLTYFDPTLSSHDDRLIKGVVEGLMLKRSLATVYLAQEGDTLGKDSELATTLIRGKPVIVYVPQIDDRDRFISQLRDDLVRAAQDDPTTYELPHPEHLRLIDRFRSLPPKYWGQSLSEHNARSEGDEAGFDSDDAYADALNEYVDALEKLYDKRASDFRDVHPLGVQVMVSSGVPNGVLVVRSVEDCQSVLRAIVQRTLEFEILGRTEDGSDWVPDFEAPVWSDRKLVEKKTKCVFRFALGENPISNSFWNWYVDEVEEGDQL